MNRAELYRQELNQIFSEYPTEMPDLIIEFCPGRNGFIASGHSPFVVVRWRKNKPQLISEYGNLEDAMELNPTAGLWPSTFCCHACGSLSWEEMEALSEKGNPYKF